MSPPGNGYWQVSAAAGVSPLGVVATPSAITIACDAIGNPKAGQFPISIAVKVNRAGVVITPTTTFALSAQLCSATDHGAGAITLDGATADNAYLEIDVVESGQAALVGIAVTKVRDGAPAGLQTIGISPSASSSYSVGTVVKTLSVGPNGTVNISMSLDYQPITGGAGTYNVQAVQAFYRTTPGSGTWVSFGSELVGSRSGQGADIAPGEPRDLVQGAASLSQTLAGPTTAARWEFSFCTRQSSGNRGPSGSGVASVSFTA